jgi:hypothetical protein
MKKFSLIAILFSAILLLENCKKDTVVATATSTNFFIANIKDSTWYTDTVSATLTFNSATNTKTFACSGTSISKELAISVTTKSSANSAGFPIGTYNVDATSNLVMNYLTLQKDANGNLVYTPVGVVNPGSGTIAISAVDSVKHVITGTFSFTTLKNNYDGNGNITSISVAAIAAGGINSMPYTFISK